MNPYLIGIDVGTTGTKTVVFRADGAAQGSGYKEYSLQTAGREVTQDAEDWWQAVVQSVCEATRGLDPQEIAGIGISAQGASMTAVDREFRPLCPVMTWMDSRAQQEAEELAAALGKEKIYRACGWPVNPSLDAAKLIWMQKREPELYARAHQFVSTLEFVNQRLTGNSVIDPTCGAIRQLFNIARGDWDDDILHVVGVERSRLPKVRPTGAPVGGLTAQAAEELGLPEKTPVFNGAHDQYCASLGSGAVRPGDLLLATGTTWVVFGIADHLMFSDTNLSPGIHPAGGFGAMASLVTAGSALKWYKNLIGGDYALIDREAEKRIKSAENLFFLPYLAGAGFPHNRPDQRAEIYGLSLSHDRYDLALALMEGVAFEAELVLEEFRKQGIAADRLIMTGGAARSEIWSKLVEWITGCAVYRMTQPETCCAGAAIIAGVGAGVFPSYDEAASVMAKMEPLEARNSEMHSFYRKKSERYRSYANKERQP